MTTKDIFKKGVSSLLAHDLKGRGYDVEVKDDGKISVSVGSDWVGEIDPVISRKQEEEKE